MVLGYRAEYLARAHAAGAKPVLVLATTSRWPSSSPPPWPPGPDDRVHCVHFHKWARAQLVVAYGQSLPANNQSSVDAFLKTYPARHHRRGPGPHPTGQYLAVLIDEGHDFAPEWLKLVTQMVDPTTNSLLVLYDDAQSILRARPQKNFSFKSVGIQAQGRTHHPRSTTATRGRSRKPPTPSRATCSPPKTATTTASPRQTRELRPRRPRAHRHPPAHPARTGSAKIAELLQGAHADGFAWGDMAVLCRTEKSATCASTLYKRGRASAKTAWAWATMTRWPTA